MDKHTPGPWYTVYSETDEFGGGNIRSNNHGDGKGALLFVTGPMFNDYTVNREEELANLHLATSAPLMLEALQEIVADIEAYCDDWNSGTPTDVTILLPKLHAAIDRATYTNKN